MITGKSSQAATKLRRTAHTMAGAAAVAMEIRVCSLARLRADALRLCGEAVRQDADRVAGDHLDAERRGPGRVLPPGAIRPERRSRRGRSGACRAARP